MKEPLHIEVEPLGEQRWDRIERSLMERLKSEPRNPSVSEPPGVRFGPRAWLAAAAVVAAVVVAVLALSPSAEHTALEQPSRITTGQSSSHLALPGFSVEVQPESAVVVGAETQQGLLLVLDGGSIVCQVAPRKKDAPMIVQAGGVRVRVVGTRFSVTRLGESARVKVDEGVVEVSAGGETVRVGAGEEWPARVVERQTRDVSQRAEPERAGEAKSAAADESSLPVEGRKAKAQRAGGGTQSAEARTAKKDTEDVGRPSSQEVFERATVLEQSDPARASKLYRSLESGSGSWAQNALYARGRLAASRGNPGEARRLLQLYLQRYPRGSNAEDARAVLRRLR